MKHSLWPWSLSASSCNLVTSLSTTSSIRLARAMPTMILLGSSSSNCATGTRSYHASTKSLRETLDASYLRTKRTVTSLQMSPLSACSRAMMTHASSNTIVSTSTQGVELKSSQFQLLPPPFSFLRSFSSSSLTSPLQALPLLGLLLSKMPRLKSEDGPPSKRRPSRRHPSPLFGHKPQSPSSPSNGARGPNRLLSYMASLDTRFFSGLPQSFVLYTLLALNFLVFISWLYASETLRKFSDSRPFIFLCKNFLSGWLNLSEGRWWTMITSCLSHAQLGHFLVNMISLSFMAPPVLALTGPSTFLALYFGAGVASSIVSMIGKKVVHDDKEGADFSHGASGSVYAIMSTFACVHPKATFLMFFVIPAPAWACVTGIFAWDLWHAANRPGGRTDSAGHLGGIATGILFWRFGLRGVRAS
ncbi:uncharacterized protein UHO2_03126 [Ustilago hordei]|uniref:uncharacterized protein n=1 Tax=Ustilago hordei TaxID=120017 RepID=UPI001A3A0BDF|nr:uncharacterized protein UHO2_03126 [Ustilago hordei]SYW83899.1 related to PCP1 - mitochondrial serine protease [Ustilago hordei]